MTDLDLTAIAGERDRIRDTYLHERDGRALSSARGLHHVALLCSDVERTVRFYQGVLEFPLTEIFENRDYAGSNHFFFDIGNGNLLAFFDLPGLDLGPYAEVLGGLHHLAIWWSRSGGSGSREGCRRLAWLTRRRAEPRSTFPTPTGFASS